MSFSVKKGNQVISSTNFFNYVSSNNNWTVSGNNIYNNNIGNVGVNTSAPAAQFDVNGQCILSTPLVKIGLTAGQTGQGSNSVAIGTNAGQSFQNSNSVAIGNLTGQFSQGANSVAIGFGSAFSKQGNGCVAIGREAAGYHTTAQNFQVSLGEFAGATNQGQGAIAIGLRTGGTNQGQQAIGIGYNTAQTTQGNFAIAIGRGAGDISQGGHAIAIGEGASSAAQGSNAICIGRAAASTFQNSIVLNATGASMVSDVSNAFFVRPVSVIADVSTNFLVYNNVSGRISYNPASVKTFVIDHPTDNDKYLVHACLEGPEAGVYYRGSAEITNDEFVDIELPEYTKAFNNFTIHVSPHGKFNKLWTSEVENNSFRVFGNNGKFFWTVFATREDINVAPLKSEVVVSGNGPYKYIL